jgi:hypothetical protein
MRQSFASPSLDTLVDLACRDGVDIRPTLLRVLTDLYVQKPSHSAEEEVQYVELALGLIGAVDAATRAAVAARLAAYPAAPAAVLDRLGLRRSAAESRGSDSELADIFFAAGADERRLILANLDVVASAAAPPPPADLARRLEQAAMQRDVGAFCRALEQALGIGRVIAERIARDASGEAIVVAAKALRMEAAALQRVLLFLDPRIGHSVARVFDLARLYDELSPAAADRMLAIWRQADRASKPRYEPLHWDDERRSARAPAAHGGRRVTRAAEPLPSPVTANGR